MTAEEKATEFINKYWRVDDSKYCALIAVDEILIAVFEHQNAYDYWQEVKKEIERR